MKFLLPEYPRAGEGCIRRDDRNDAGLDCPSIEELVGDIESVVSEFPHRIRKRHEEIKDRKRHERVEGVVAMKLEEVIKEEEKRIKDELCRKMELWSCGSSQGLTQVSEILRCGKYHLVFAPGLRKQGRTPDTLKPKMKELTRIWAVCQPKATVIVCSESEMVAQLKKDYHKWVETYKCWGGEVRWIPFEIRSLGFQVIAGYSSTTI